MAFGNKPQPEQPSKTESHSKPKFLPFVTKQTGPESIFKSLFQRSKGLTDKNLFVIYSSILRYGIDEIHQFLKTLPASSDSAQVYDAICNKYGNLLVEQNVIKYWGFILLNYDLSKIKNSEFYTFNDLSIMFSAMVTYCPEKLEEINFNCDPNLFVVFYKNDSFAVKKLEHTEFNGEGKRVGFTSYTEFKAYLAYREYSYKENDCAIMPVQLKHVTSYLDVTNEHYTNNYCVSPYPHSSNPKVDREGEKDDDVPF